MSQLSSSSPIVSDHSLPLVSSHIYPFVAVVGQALLKRALILATIDPRLGGVLIQGPRGIAKSTLSRGLADLIQSKDDAANSAAFVELPLGTSAERLTGSLDLEQIIKHQEVSFKPGLFAKAHGGILYSDEVNLLDDNLVDLLLDVAAHGVNRIEKDGLSHEHPALFVLIGTMNPEEGELRPQLSDRFGLSVELDSHIGVEDRMEIVQQRMAFDADPVGFIARYQVRTEQLKSHIHKAHVRLPTTVISLELQREIARRAMDADVEGVRADIAWRRAAVANAAFEGRANVDQSDIDAVEPLVLGHRSNHVPPSRSNRGSGNASSNTQVASSQANSSPDPSHTTGEMSQQKSLPDDEQFQSTRGPSSKTRSSLLPLLNEEGQSRHRDHHQTFASLSSAPPLSAYETTSLVENEIFSSCNGNGTPPTGNSNSRGRKQQDESLASLDDIAVPERSIQIREHYVEESVEGRGRAHEKRLTMSAKKSSSNLNKGAAGPERATFPSSFGVSNNKTNFAYTGGIDWFSTFTDRKNFQTGTKETSASSDTCINRFSYQCPKARKQMMTLILLDISASTLTRAAIDRAAEAVLKIAQQAKPLGHQFALLVFGFGGCRWICRTRRVPARLSTCLKKLRVGGGTPLNDALSRGRHFIQQRQRQCPGIECNSWLITDGRTTEFPSTFEWPSALEVIDTEQGRIRLGRAKVWANQLGAGYRSLDQFMTAPASLSHINNAC